MMEESCPKPVLQIKKGKKKVYRVYLLDRRPRKRGYGTIWIVLAFISVIVITIVLADLLTGRNPHVKEPLQRASETLTFTDCGMIQGTVELIDGRKIYVYRGIPYALPPIGKLRWQPPVSIKVAKSCWSGTYKAVKNGEQCVQYGRSPGTLLGSEDCLYLNIFTPSLNKSKQLPVVFWIHDGSWRNGNDIQDFLPDQRFSDSNEVVTVTLNYRLNLFGFLSLKVLARFSMSQSSGNYGLLDQIEALKWTNRNIRNFGGNPYNVIIVGQNAGGTSVLALLSSPMSGGLFSKAVSMGGEPVKKHAHENAYDANEDFIEKVDCLKQSARDVYICLQNLTPTQIMWSQKNSVRVVVNVTELYIHRKSRTIFVTDITPFCVSGEDFNDIYKMRSTTVPVMIGRPAELSQREGRKSSETIGLENVDSHSERQKSLNDTQRKLKSSNPTFNTLKRFLENVTELNKNNICGWNEFLNVIVAMNYTVFEYYFNNGHFQHVTKQRMLLCDNFPMWEQAALFGLPKTCKPNVTQVWLTTIFRRDFRAFVSSGRPATKIWKPFPRSALEYNAKGLVTRVSTKKRPKCS